jgi:hypothetical protein
VFTGNTGDPKTLPEAVDAVRGTFGLQRMIMAGDRGMITPARITALRDLEGMAWISGLRGPAVNKLMVGDDPLQLPGPAPDLAPARRPCPRPRAYLHARLPGFRDLLDHLATLTRNDLRYGQVTIPALAEPTPAQRRAFDLIGAPIPLTLAMT